MNDKQLMKKLVELFQIVSELCGYELSKINKTKPIDEINKLMDAMKEQRLGPYKSNPINMTNWDSYSKKLEEFIDALKQRGDI